MSVASYTDWTLAQTTGACAAVGAAWFEVREQDLPLWNHLLLDTDTSLYQYPFWNDPYRALGLTPRYLAWGTQDRPLGFVSILTVGFGPAKIGLVFRGPTCLERGAELSQSAIAELLNWAREQGYVFIRFTHSDSRILSQLAASARAEDLDAFPYFLDFPVLSPDYVIDQFDDDDQTLAIFDREVRRKIRRATEVGYQFQCEDSPDALARVWSLHQDCAQRKHFRLERPLSVYMNAMQLARPQNCVRLYSALLHGKVVGSLLIFRDATTAYCQLAAFDAPHRRAAVLLHWHAMRDLYHLGARRYNLGPGPGSLARFKRQFCEHPVSYSGPLTVVLKENWFRIWWTFVFPVAKRLKPTVRKIVFHVNR
jgi:hypothetical protein